jgi:6-phosphogluconolactonase
MTRPDGALVVVPSETELARTLAESFGVAAHDAIASRGIFNVALTGGSTPKAAYALIAAPPYNGTVQWPHVRFFFGDERCVPPDHPDSNYRMAYETLLAPLHIPSENVLRMRGEDEPAAAAAAYADILRLHLGSQPSFDLVLLGMGADGHTASLFPGTPPDDATKSLVQPRTAPPGIPIAQRLSLTPYAINAARKIIIAVAGSAKAQILARVLSENCDPTNYPVQSIYPTQGRLTWLVDEAAASIHLSRVP